MDELFGAPLSSIAIVLGILFAIIGAGLVYIAVRNPILVRMALRNVRRRPARGVLIIIGLMLATAIISSAFTTGDSITFSIKKEATDSLRSLDEIIRVDDDSPVWEGKELPDEFPEDVFQEVGPLLGSHPDIDGVLPVITENVAVINFRSSQFEVESLFTGADTSRAQTFESLRDLRGNLIDLTTLGPGEVYIDRGGAEAIDAQVGDVLGVALSRGDLEQMTVKAIVDGWYAKRSNTKLVLMTSLNRAQELLDKEGLLSFILVSNRGDAFQGESLTATIMDRFAELPAITDRGLEVFDVKREIVEEANEIGSLFVSFFTTFGLFSIGVGLLLIFLIFSMLAAERKSEMGMSRAVGMQRRHLVRLFMAEGAIYSLGSAVVGALIGIGLGYLLVIATGDLFGEDPTEEFSITPHVEALSVLVSFFIGSVITFVTVIFASRRISRLNIVRAIRDIPEPQLARAGRRTLIWGLVVTVAGVVILLWGFDTINLTLFGLGVSLIPVGIALILRWRGVAQRWVLSGTGLILLVWWLLPPGVYNAIKDDWNQDFSVFFVSGALVVAGAVLVTINNSAFVLRVVTSTIGRVRRLTPVVKSAVSYPLRFGFRTGLSLAMFAAVIFSITVIATVIEGFEKLFDDQERLGGGYDVIAFSRTDLNPVQDLGEAVAANPDLAFLSREDEAPSHGTFRTIFDAEARLSIDVEGEFDDTIITGVDDDFVVSNEFRVALATAHLSLMDIRDV
ncbi:MAG: ABC transporter permease, partial [Dehalococcoidia bacterium]